MRKQFVVASFLLILIVSQSIAGEGMWIPSLLKHFNIKDMHKKGFRLSVEEIYSINQASLKDAVVIFGGGCTGELISSQGLLLTNHHCGYGYIQKHSTMEDNYLDDGFWAKSREEELPNPGLTATFLIRIEDVTDRVMQVVKEGMSEDKRKQLVDQTIREIESKAVEGTHYDAVIKPFYYGNEYYMFIYETFKDIRLVGTPPSSIGKFGRDRDNWMWPRHTGDFSMFRIYGDRNNEPAEYSEDNVPYNPKKHLSISLEGYEKDDFTMILGYPGSTEQYLTSHAIRLIQDYRNPQRIKLRDMRLKVMEKYMDRSERIRLKYASKQSSVSNSWKRWKGEIRGLKRLNAIEKKERLEKEFKAWVDAKKSRRNVYESLVNSFAEIYKAYKPYAMARDYFLEAGYYAIELMRFAGRWNAVASLDNPKHLYDTRERLDIQNFYNDYVPTIDREICPKMLEAYYRNVDETFHPGIFQTIKEQFDGDFKAYTQYLFSNSLFADSVQTRKFLEDFDLRDTIRVKEDPAYELAGSFMDVYQQTIRPGVEGYQKQLDSLYRIYVGALRSMQEGKIFWPDANFTMRVAYGTVKDYNPRDAVVFKYHTTLAGVMKKNLQDMPSYSVPARLRELYKKKDYGRYANKAGEMPVCFIASNHTSGGNSGSPVINAHGELIGINFDRNWEGTMSDMMYDPQQCRNISVDIRYVLFIIDKFADAGHLIEEMNLQGAMAP